MPHRTFLAFMGPSLLAMFLFIALPILSIIVQSLYIEHTAVIVITETCQPFGGCTEESRVDTAATEALRAEQPLGQFNGLGTYVDRAHLATDEIARAWSASDSWGAFLSALLNLPFYRALAFTLTYCLVVTPCALALGFGIALAVNTVAGAIRGPVIFFSLIPMIITPLIGALVLYWMLDSQGILGAALQNLVGDPTLSMRASTPLTWIMLLIYGTWTNAPFSFIVLYAGLQAVSRETQEAAMIDGASRWERVRFDVIPSLRPLILFIVLAQVMDNFKVFEPVISFNSEASATSLSFLIYSSLNTQTTQFFGSAAATSVITIGFITVLILPIILRVGRELLAARDH
jgi:ABC-type sugar transport system permease subunit